MKKHDQVLKTLLDLDDHQGNYFNLRSTLENIHPDLSRDELYDILNQFRTKKLISASIPKTKREISFIRVNAAAYAYYKNREALDEAEKLEKAEAAARALAELEASQERIWNYKMTLIGYIAGLISGIAIMWASFNYFR